MGQAPDNQAACLRAYVADSAFFGYHTPSVKACRAPSSRKPMQTEVMPARNARRSQPISRERIGVQRDLKKAFSIDTPAKSVTKSAAAAKRKQAEPKGPGLKTDNK